MPTAISAKSSPIQQLVDARKAGHPAINHRIRQTRQKMTGAAPCAGALWFWLDDLVPPGADQVRDGKSI